MLGRGTTIGLVSLAVAFVAPSPCSARIGRSWAPSAPTLEFEEGEDVDGPADFLQVRQAPDLSAAIAGAFASGGSGSSYPEEIVDPASGYDAPSSDSDSFGRRRNKVATSTFTPTEVKNGTVPCVVNGNNTPEVITVRVPVIVESNGTGTSLGRDRIVKVKEVEYVNVPGDTKYVTVPGETQYVPYTVPGQAGATVPGQTAGCPPCPLTGAAAAYAGYMPSTVPPGCPLPAPCISGTNAVAKAAAQAAELAHANMQAMLRGAFATASPLVADAHAVAQHANEAAAHAEDMATMTQAGLGGVEQSVKRLRSDLYHAATARAAELKKVRVVPPTFPVSLMPEGPPSPAAAPCQQQPQTGVAMYPVLDGGMPKPESVYGTPLPMNGVGVEDAAAAPAAASGLPGVGTAG